MTFLPVMSCSLSMHTLWTTICSSSFAWICVSSINLSRGTSVEKLNWVRVPLFPFCVSPYACLLTKKQKEEGTLCEENVRAVVSFWVFSQKCLNGSCNRCASSVCTLFLIQICRHCIASKEWTRLSFLVTCVSILLSAIVSQAYHVHSSVMRFTASPFCVLYCSLSCQVSLPVSPHFACLLFSPKLSITLSSSLHAERRSPLYVSSRVSTDLDFSKNSLSYKDKISEGKSSSPRKTLALPSFLSFFAFLVNVCRSSLASVFPETSMYLSLLLFSDILSLVFYFLLRLLHSISFSLFFYVRS